MSEAPALRPGRDADGPAMVRLIERCWADYPGCVMDLDGENPHLRAPATHYAGKGGSLTVAVDVGGSVVGTVSTVAGEAPATVELKGLYVDAAFRGTGLAQRLLDRVEDEARSARASHLVLWSDTRFERAHRFYERAGFVARDGVRALGDRSNSIEYGFGKPMGRAAVERLDAAAARSAVRALATVTVAAVERGASISFMQPLATAEAERFWAGAASGVAEGALFLFAGWSDGRLAGTVTLVPAWQPNGPHRGELAKLVVHPDARRRGLGDALLDAAERHALANHRTLLTLDTVADGVAERLYRRRGYREAGRIPGYALSPTGVPETTVLLFRDFDKESPP